MSTPPRVTFVLPCHNERSRIASSLETLDSWFPDAEILVVDDGSADGTAEEAERYASRRPSVRVVSLAHRGKGGAVRSAIPLLRTDRAVVLDADLAFDRESVQRALDALDTSEMAIGNRRRAESRYSVPVRLFGFLYRRHLAGLLFNAFVRAATGLKHRDTQCGLKAYRRSCLESFAPVLSIDGFALDVEILVAARARCVQVAEVPVRVRYDSAKSSVKLLVSGRAMAADILKIAVGRLRGRYRNPATTR